LRPRDAALGVDSFVLSLRTMFDPVAAEGLEASYELGIGEDTFRAEVSWGSLEIERGTVEQPDAVIEGDPGALGALVYEGRGLDEALRSGDVRIEGDRSKVERFLTLFPLPETAASAAASAAT
jgi:hypothetical protein